MPGLVHNARAEPGAPQRRIPDPPAERRDLDGPTVLIEEDIVAAQARLCPIDTEQLIDRLQHRNIPDALLGLGQPLDLAHPCGPQ